MEQIVIALPKGRMFEPVVDILTEVNLINPDINLDVISRKLVFIDDSTENSFLLAKPKDVPVYVEHGAADIGITGKDVILEHSKKTYELFDFGISKCKLVVAVPEESGIGSISEIPEHSRVATSYPKIAGDFFKENGNQVEIIHLNGSVELAPQVGLADLIVDITSTGRTLKRNHLLPIAEVMKSSARMIVNNVSYKTKYKKINRLFNELYNWKVKNDEEIMLP